MSSYNKSRRKCFFSLALSLSLSLPMQEASHSKVCFQGMGLKSDVLDSWRTFFCSAGSNIFDVIDHAILVAASDYPKEFQSWRVRILEKQFSPDLSVAEPKREEDNEVGNGFKESTGSNSNPEQEKEEDKNEVGNGFQESLVSNSKPVQEKEEDNEVGGNGFQERPESNSKPEQKEKEEDNNEVSGNGFQESDLGCNVGFDNKEESKENSRTHDDDGKDMDSAETLTHGEIKGQGKDRTIGEVLWIKRILENHRQESHDVLYESLRSLELMRLTIETLQETQIGRTVNSMRKHELKKIRQFSRALIKGWKKLVNEWCDQLEGTKPQQEGDLVDHVQNMAPVVDNFQEKSKCANKIVLKLEASKRKFVERYQQLENAKKQRAVQVMELHDLPKQKKIEKKRR